MLPRLFRALVNVSRQGGKYNDTGIKNVATFKGKHVIKNVLE